MMWPLNQRCAGIEANDTASFFPDLDELAIKKLFGFLHRCFVVLAFNDLRRLPGCGHLCRKCKCDRLARRPRNSKGYNGRLVVPVVS